MKKIWDKILRSPEDGNGAAGGGQSGTGSNSLLGNSNGGGTPAAKTLGTSDTSGANGTGNSGSNNSAAGNAPTDWRSTLPSELQEDATIKKFTSVHALAGAYLNAQKLIGADKIAVPGKHTTEEEWKGIYQKLGLPEKMDDYAVKFKDGVNVGADFSKAFQAKSFEMGILPKQAQALADWFSDSTLASEQAMTAKSTADFEKTVKDLQKEWGNAFDLNVSRANKALKELGGEDMVKYFAETGLGGNHQVVKFLAAAGEKLFGEHKIVDGQGTSSTMNPKELEAEIRKVQSNPAYTDKMHPSHKAIVAEAKELFEKRYNTQK